MTMPWGPRVHLFDVWAAVPLLSIKNLMDSLSAKTITESKQSSRSLDDSKKMQAARNAKKIHPSRHQLQRPANRESRPKSSLCTSFGSLNHLKPSKSSRSILVVKTQDESMRSSFGSTSGLHRRRSCEGRLNASFDSSASLKSTGSNVSFSKVDIRKYPRILGDNPSVSSGPPMSMGWKHQSREEISVDEYERSKPEGKKAKKLTTTARIELLETESSFSEIMRASSESALIRQQRMQTYKQSRSSERVEEMVETARKSLKRVLSSKSKMSKMGDTTPSMDQNQARRTNANWDTTTKKTRR